MFRVLRRGLQQQTTIRVDHSGTPPMNPVPFVERRLATLPAFRLDDRMGKLDLAHFQDGGAGCGGKCWPRSQAKGKTKAICGAGDGSDAWYADVGRDIEQPATPRRDTLPQLRQQGLSHDLSLIVGPDRSAAVAPLPPKAGRVPLDQLKYSVQGRGIPGPACGRSGTQRKRRLDLPLGRRPAQAQVCPQQDLAAIDEPRCTVPWKVGI